MAADPAASSPPTHAGAEAARALAAEAEALWAAPVDPADPTRIAAWHRAEHRVLTARPPAVRMVALALVGPACGTEETLEEAPTVAGALAAAVARARLSPMSAREADATWQALVAEGLDAPVPAALSALRLALHGPHPLPLTDPGDLDLIAPGAAREILALGLGWHAARGQRTAELLARRLLAAAGTDARVRTCVLKGLGAGLASDGISWVARRARHAVADRKEWLGAAAAAGVWGARRDALEAMACVEAVLSGAEDATVRSVLTALETRARVTGRSDAEVYQPLLELWTRWPAAIRALLLRRSGLLSGRHDARWLHDASPQVLLVGLATLGEQPPLDADLRPRLQGLLDHPEPSVRRAVTTRLARERAPAPVIQAAPAEPRGEVVTLPTKVIARQPLDRLRAALSGDEPETVPGLVRGLDEADHEAARQALLGALDVPDVAVRRAAVEALADVGRPEDAGTLLDAARRVRGLEGLVVKALRSVGDTRSVEAVARLFHRRLKWADDEAIDDFVALAGHAASPELVTALTTRFYPPARSGAARALARHGLREAVFTLRTRSMTDPNEDARRAALVALQQLTGSAPSHEEISGYALLISPIDDLDQAVERARQAGAAALPGLRRTLTKGSWRRRSAACEVLAQIPGDAAEATLVDAMLDADEDVRMAARVALDARGWAPADARGRTLVALSERRLDRMRDRPAEIDVATLEQALRLGGHIFRTEVLATLEACRAAGHWNPGRDAAAAIAATRLDPDSALRESEGLHTLLLAIDRTWQLHPHRAILMRPLQDVAPEALNTVMGERDWGWRAREAACMALGRAGDNGGIDLLVRYVLDPDEDVRSAAVESLVRIGTRDAALALARGAESPFQEDADAVARGLAAVGSMAVPAIRGLARAPWWEARRVSALALRDWRGDLQEAADIALTLAVDPEYRVAEIARETLWRHGVRPSAASVRDTLQRAQELSVAGLEPWLGLGAHGRLQDGRARALLGQILATRAPDALPQRIGLAAALRVPEVRAWLESAASGASTDHAGVRLAAARTLLALADPSCRLCRGRGTVGCVSCDGQGDQRCAACEGRGVLKRPCPEPDCNARETTRSIRSRACKTCRGRGEVPDPCECVQGRVPCDLCHGNGRTVCLLCEGTGESPTEPPPAATA